MKERNIYSIKVPDNTTERKIHELQCFQRWFIFRDFMRAKRLDLAYFGDGDSSVFVNITNLYRLHPGCEAVVNVEAQSNNYHWVAAGEASIWTLKAIEDFCR